ncbi:MAG: N-acetyltransferase [Myxococcales bacterium]|nr:N-acetyltransferase [Myxococcales bacterium]
MLHFELCYYQPITWALEHGITLSRPAHKACKAKRGLLPRACHSAHRFCMKAWAAIRAHLKAERRHILRTWPIAKRHGPFHRA